MSLNLTWMEELIISVSGVKGEYKKTGAREMKPSNLKQSKRER